MGDILPGTEVEVRGLQWEVVESQSPGNQTRVRLRGLRGTFGGVELDILPPFVALLPLTPEFHPAKAGRLAEWLVYHQAFLLEQALGPDVLLAIQPVRLRSEPYLLAKYERQRHRLHFVSNTLGVALTELPQAGLFAVLSCWLRPTLLVRTNA